MCYDDCRWGFVSCLDADGKQGSCSHESTPLHADWPPASLSIPAQAIDQSQDGHLSRAPLLPGDALLTTQAGHFDGSRLPDRPKDSLLEPQLANDELLSRPPKKTEDQLIPDNISPSLPGWVESGSVGIQSTRVTSQETRTLTLERRSVETTLDDMSGSSECVQLPLSEQLSPFSQVGLQLDAVSEQHRQSAASTLRPAENVSVSARLVDQRRKVVGAQVESGDVEVTTPRQDGSSSLHPTSSILPSSDSSPHQLETSGTALQRLHSAPSSLSFAVLSSVWILAFVTALMWLDTGSMVVRA